MRDLKNIQRFMDNTIRSRGKAEAEKIMKSNIAELNSVEDKSVKEVVENTQTETVKKTTRKSNKKTTA